MSKYRVCVATSWSFNCRYFPFTAYYGRHILILLFKLLQPPTLWFWLDEYAVFTCYDCVNAPTAATSSKPWLLSSPTRFFVFPGVNNCLFFFFQLPSGWVFFVNSKFAVNYMNRFFTYSFASGTLLLSSYWRSFSLGPLACSSLLNSYHLNPFTCPWFGSCHILILTLPGFFSRVPLSLLTKSTWWGGV